jgi:hypothetical protein
MSLFQNIYFSFIFLADDSYNKRIFLFEKLTVFGKLLVTFGPLAFILNLINAWFLTNREFVSGFICVVIINAIFGMLQHKKMRTFRWEIFLQKTSIMLLCVIAIYILLSIIGNFTGDSFVAEGFQIFIQVSTLFYPVSKAIKSIHILSGGEYPSEFIMKKFYNFKKDGDVQEFFKTTKSDSYMEVTNFNPTDNSQNTNTDEHK